LIDRVHNVAQGGIPIEKIILTRNLRGVLFATSHYQDTHSQVPWAATLDPARLDQWNEWPGTVGHYN